MFSFLLSIIKRFFLTVCEKVSKIYFLPETEEIMVNDDAITNKVLTRYESKI